MTEPCHERQLCAAFLAALFAPAATVCARLGPAEVAVAAGGAMIYYLYIWYLSGRYPDTGLADLTLWAAGDTVGKSLLILQGLWLLVMACAAARQSADIFPGGSGFPFIPAVLLGLAAWAVGKGLTVVARTCAVLFLFLVAVFLLVLGFGAESVSWQYLKENGGSRDALAALTVLLLPGLATQFRGQVRGRAAAASWGAAAGTVCLLVSVVSVGNLGLTQAKYDPQPFFCMVESLRILGVMERFEALVAAVLTVSWFALISLLVLASAESLASAFRVREKKRLATRLCGVLLGGIWLADRLETRVLQTGTILFCGLFPMVILGMVGMKKLPEKCEKKR